MRVLADLPQRARIAVWCGSLSVLAASAALSFGPLVRGAATRAAEPRGLELRIGSVSPGWGGIWLKEIDVSAPLVPGAKVHLASLRVGLGWRLNLTELTVHGGEVELSGTADELERQLTAYRESRPKESDSTAGGDIRYSADGLGVTWNERRSAPSARVWGLRYVRDGAHETFEADLAHANNGATELDATGPEARIVRARDRRELERLRVAELDLSISLESSQSTETGVAATVRGAGKNAEFRPDPTRSTRLRALLELVSNVAGRALPEGATLDLEGVRVRFQRGAEQLNIGPSALTIGRIGSELRASLVPKAEASGTPLELKLTLPLGPGDARAEVRGGPISLRSLGVREGDFGLIGVQAATLRASGEVTFAADKPDLAFDGNGELEQVSLARPELAPQPLSGMHLTFRARGSAALDGSRVVLDDGELGLGEVRLQAKGELSRAERELRMRWTGGVPLASCQAFLDATPRGLAPLIAPMRMTGTFAVNAEVAYDSLRPSDTRVRLDVMNDCRISQIPLDLSPKRFASVWQREVKGADKQPLEIESGPGSPDWVPYEAISPFMETAVEVCEDGHFERHHGFDYEAIQNSIKDNLIKGRFVRGASTVSMQLAKNLYLGKEKTLGRKLQEAALTLLLEQELSKRELMELYLNVIEYAPGVYGIGPAAKYYFGERPSDLSLGQALYIASILPNPEHQHFDKDGRVSAAWTRYLQRLMGIAKKIGKITPEQLDAGLAEQVAFHVADSGPAAPLPAAPEEGTDTPTELSP